MTRRMAGVAVLVLASALPAPAAGLRLVVTDLPYARVWTASIRALDGYPLARAAEGVIVTERVERARRVDEAGARRVAERITLRVEAFGALSTRITIQVEAWALEAGAWVPLRDTAGTARVIAERLRAAQG